MGRTYKTRITCHSFANISDKYTHVFLFSMVRSRSETNLNKIFLDLCTSPEVRSKHGHSNNHQRTSNPPLPTLQSIKSVSNPDLNKISENEPQTSSVISMDNESLDLTTPLPIPPLARHELPVTEASVATPLIPMESTGFTVQTTTWMNSTDTSEQQQISSFPTQSFPLRNTFRHHHHHHHRQESNSNETSLIKKTSSGDKKQQDYTCRLRDRLKSREHLRKFFLS